MDKAVLSVILGAIAFFLTGFIGPLSLILSIIGLIIGISAIRSPGKELDLPFGVKIGNKKKKTVKPYVSNRYVAWLGIIVNGISLFIALTSIAVLGVMLAAILGNPQQ